MTDEERQKLRQLYIDAGWSEEEIAAAENINEQMGKFFKAINPKPKPKDKSE